MALSCSGINFIINSIYFSWHGNDYQVTTTYLLFPADDRLEVPTCVSAQAFLTHFQSKYRKMIHSGVIAKASSFLIKKTDFHFFRYLMSHSRVKMDGVYGYTHRPSCLSNQTSTNCLHTSPFSSVALKRKSQEPEQRPWSCFDRAPWDQWKN